MKFETRYEDMFERLNRAGEGAFVPFVTIGDPNGELSFEIIRTLIESGADALELGFPFSDPLADGPTIQGASIRALRSGATPDTCFELLKLVRSLNKEIPIGLLMYANLVYARGIDDFFARCADAGVDSVLIADVPTGESAPFRASAAEHGIHSVYIAPPNAKRETLKAVAELGSGYTYLLSRAGVTGTETKAKKPVDNLLETLSEFGAAPPLLGFGISEPSQVAEAIASGAAGAISGSAVVKIIENHLDDPAQMLSELAAFIRSMKKGSDKT